jgi:hypothetical protein
VSEVALRRIRDLIQDDVNDRGLAKDPWDNLLTACPDDFASACRSIAEQPEAGVCVVTGFYIAHGDPPAGETDGPLGAVFLARELTALGVEVALATDKFCLPALRAGLEVCGLSAAVRVNELPLTTDAAAFDRFWRRMTQHPFSPTHLVALERVGPGHTSMTMAAPPNGLAAVKVFEREVAPADRSRCRNMRGVDVTPSMSPAHMLFDAHGPIRTIGIGDGGNEIGMGKIPWDVIRRNIPNGGLIACRVPTDHLIVSGVSNWGAYGLAAGVRLLRGAPHDPQLFDVEAERRLLETMVEHGPLVDGVTGKRTATVDGLSFERYAAVLSRIGEVLAEYSPG